MVGPSNDRPFDRVSRQSLPEAIAEQLSRRLEAGEYQVGHQLPGHRQLATAFGVSVPVVREALSRLAAQGLLEIRPGQGTYVRAPKPDSSTDDSAFLVAASTLDELFEILEARTVLETELVAFASERADDSQIDTLQRLVDKMWAARHDPSEFLEADLAFHIALAEAARNTILLRAMMGLRTSMRDFLEVRSVETTRTEEGVEVAVRHHQDIVDTLRARDPEGAREVVRVLMQRAYTALVEQAAVLSKDAPKA